MYLLLESWSWVSTFNNTYKLVWQDIIPYVGRVRQQCPWVQSCILHTPSQDHYHQNLLLLNFLFHITQLITNVINPQNLPNYFYLDVTITKLLVVSAHITRENTSSSGEGRERSSNSKKPRSMPVPEGWQNFWPAPFWKGNVIGSNTSGKSGINQHFSSSLAK